MKKFLAEWWQVGVFIVLGAMAVVMVNEGHERRTANAAIERALTRMMSVQGDEPSVPAMVIACNSGDDPVGCWMESATDTNKGFIHITYFTGDQDHKKVFATQRLWVKAEPVIHREQLEFH